MRAEWKTLGIAATAGRLAFGVLFVTAPAGGCDAGVPSLGEAVEPDGTGTCITSVHIDIPTVHFTGQEWIIGSAEGRGPRDLSVDVAEFVQPQVITNTTVTPDPKVVSEAVGYSVTERYQVTASSRVSVTPGVFDRLEAYTSYQRAVWEIHDAACAAHLGLGVSYKPIGVFFQTIEANDVALPDPGVVVPDCQGAGCIPLIPPAPAGGPSHDGTALPAAPGASPPDAGAPDSETGSAPLDGGA